MPYCSNCGSEIKAEYTFCPECGRIISARSNYDSDVDVPAEDVEIDYRICQRCGKRNPIDAPYCIKCKTKFNRILVDDESDYATVQKAISSSLNQHQGIWKKKWISLLLCIFFGWTGAHKFYEGRIIGGLVFLFTLGLFGIGWIVDIFLICCKSSEYRVR